MSRQDHFAAHFRRLHYCLTVGDGEGAMPVSLWVSSRNSFSRSFTFWVSPISWKPTFRSPKRRRKCRNTRQYWRFWSVKSCHWWSSGRQFGRRHVVCLYDFEVGEEIKRLTNCKHIFHQSCLDHWMDHDQKTYPLCRTPFVPDEIQDAFNQRLWAASGITDFYNEYGTVFGL